VSGHSTWSQLKVLHVDLFEYQPKASAKERNPIKLQQHTATVLQPD
jgi:hypothetical protein